MGEACVRVVRNGGAGGVDGMAVSELPDWLDANHGALASRILAGRYSSAVSAEALMSGGALTLRR